MKIALYFIFLINNLKIKENILETVFSIKLEIIFKEIL